MPKYDIVAIGDILIDFVNLTKAGDGAVALSGNAGGAPANVLCAAAKLGLKTVFIGRVGRDAFGAFLKRTLDGAGVDTSALVEGEEPTTLAMVSLDETGDRSFSFYRNGTADVSLQESDVDMRLVADARMFHFGAVSLTDEPARTATFAAVTAARQAGVPVSFDPNYRPLLWRNRDEAVAMMKKGASLADYLKVSDEEAVLLTGERDMKAAARALLAQCGAKLAAVTMGPGGCIGAAGNACVHVPAYDVPCVDTTGAGDAFWGAALSRILRLPAGAVLDEETLRGVLCFANAAGSLVTTRYGAIPAMPDERAVLACAAGGKTLVVDG